MCFALMAPLVYVCNTVIIVVFIHVRRSLSTKLVIQYASVIYSATLSVSADQQKALFDGFWKTSNFNVQNACVNVCRYRKSNDIIRKVEVSPAGGTVDNTMSKLAVSVRVCKVAFLNIFGISNSRLDVLLKLKRLHPTLKEQLTLEWTLHKIQAEVGYK